MRPAGVPPQHHTLGVGGSPIAVHFTEFILRSPQTPVFVLVHGLGTSHRYFGRLQRQLARLGDTVTIDLPGFGGTPGPNGKQSVEELAGTVGALMDRLSLQRVILVGHSLGAQITTQLARIRPALVSHLVLIGPVTDPRRATALRQSLALLRDIVREPFSANLLVFADYLRCGPRRYFAELPAMLGFRTDAALASVEAPALVVRGGDDPVATSDWCRRLVAGAPHGQLLEIAGHHHLVQLTASARTAAGIDEFLRSHPAPTAAELIAAEPIAAELAAAEPTAAPAGQLEP